VGVPGLVQMLIFRGGTWLDRFWLFGGYQNGLFLNIRGVPESFDFDLATLVL
jgi:hypothetical protein